jgi:hypothetical protein
VLPEQHMLEHRVCVCVYICVCVCIYIYGVLYLLLQKRSSISSYKTSCEMERGNNAKKLAGSGRYQEIHASNVQFPI